MRALVLPAHRVSIVCAAVLWVSCGSADDGTEVRETAGFLRVSGEVEAAGAGASEATADTPTPSLGQPAAADRPVDAEVAALPTPSGAAPQAGDETALEQQANDWIGAQEFARASKQLSELLFVQIAKPLEDRASIERLAATLRRAQAGHRWNVKGVWPSIEATVQAGDSLIAIRKRTLAAHPELLLCTGLIARCNQLRSETAIRPDDVLRIPTERAAIVVDLSAMWAFYTLGGEIAEAWEVGVGKDGSDTQPGTYTIGLKQQRPMWSPIGREPVPFGDPANPLGTRWLAWHQDGRGTSLGFHGTNDPSGIGRRVSEGCIRMRNDDVELLYEILPQGAEVHVQP